MISPAVVASLVPLFRHESRSFLHYLAEASLWASATDQPLIRRIQRLSNADQTLLNELEDTLERQGTSLQPVGAFPIGYSSTHFVAVRSVIPRLRNELAASVQAWAALRESLGSGEIATWLQGWLDRFQANRQSTLEQFQRGAV